MKVIVDLHGYDVCFSFSVAGLGIYRKEKSLPV